MVGHNAHLAGSRIAGCVPGLAQRCGARDEQGGAQAGAAGDPGQRRRTAGGLALEQAGAAAGDEDAEAAALVGHQGVLLAGCARSVDSGQEGQAHAGGGAPPDLVEVAQESWFGDDEEVVAGAARGQEDGGAVGVLVPGSWWGGLLGHGFSSGGPGAGGRAGTMTGTGAPVRVGRSLREDVGARRRPVQLAKAASSQGAGEAV